ncbi:MOXD1 homolog 2 [Phlebotomus argentipes]|uniref:MOXD1 homolog 2 n=1 Tax=Phlebotomus argentipes TaxID=94469 RepID=UPI00289379B1|nr:MOXD1 homolog 2 [Phlebotomus argentipes]
MSSKLVSLLMIVCLSAAWGANWDHAVDLNENFRLLWTVRGAEITMEIQAKTLGYVGVGFSEDGTLSGADMAIGWVDQGQPYFQDRHVKKNSDGEPVVDPSQDYVLLLGYENATHTVLRFRRKLDTCDTYHDLPITNDTMRVIFMYHENEPRRGAVTPGSLPKPLEAYRGYRPLFLTQRVSQDAIKLDLKIRTLELRNQDVELPQSDTTLYWCKVFKLTDINKKHHLVKYEPVFESTASQPYMHHIVLYECQGSSNELELLSREQGRPCFQPDNPRQCNVVVATWARGSEGFTFPQEVGYPLDIYQARYYMMETHYHHAMDGVGVNINSPPMVDNSGLRLYYTQALRKFDAGVLSVGIDPNWRHIIPPGQERVISEGHCIEECTRPAFPPQGINIFGVMMRTHQIGKQVRLRQIRGHEELPPVASDSNTDANYQEYRRLTTPVKAYPGDRLVAECTYDSSSRKAITLGGKTTREETCLVLALYYPRQKELTVCHSLPSLPTVLHSLGIEELAVNSNPVLILLPAELAGMTLESRLVTYDWANQFDSFQRITRRGSFKPLCWGAKNTLIPGTEYIEAHSPNLTKVWHPPLTCSSKTRFVTQNNLDVPVLEEDESANVIEGAARSKVSRSSATETMGLSNATNLRHFLALLSPLVALLPLFMANFMAP